MKVVLCIIGILIGFFCFRQFYDSSLQEECLSLADVEMAELQLAYEKDMFEIDKRHICPDQEVYIKDNDQIKIITYECENHRNEADGKCRFCCIDEPTPNLNIINEICFDCEIYGGKEVNP